MLWEAKQRSCDITGQQCLPFFVPQTSIDELSSTLYAEFRYVYRMILSGRVSKIQWNLNVQDSTLSAYETGRNFPLRCRGVLLSLVFGIRYIPLQGTAIVCQHT
jgi:ABC-type glycerol-3-phosphate transport system permease component